MRASVLCVIGLLAAGTLAAQEAAPPRDVKILRFQAGAPGDPMIGLGPQATYDFVAAGPAMEGKVVTGAPYSAEGVTEIRRVLADGTTIQHESSFKVYRDGEGRTRREHQLSTIGPWAAEGAPPKIVTIHDPAAKETIVLNEREKTARRLSAPGPGDLAGAVWVQAPADGPHNVTAVAGTRVIAGDFSSAGEPLGERNIGGVIAKGSRSATAIPAGKIGNDREITITTDTWYSEELQTVVLRETKDPLSGDITYRLENIRQGEPPRTLFEIPAGYSLQEGPAQFDFHIRKEEE